ncbi:MAG: antiterminator LoaP [Clostridiales bacterium]|nr:antiterminator LoaP [Clostridiales bacterium]
MERKNGKNYEKIRHLIPGYVLTYAQMDTHLYYKLKTIPKVYNVLKSEYDPVPIRQEEMELFLALTRQGETIDFSEIYKEGDKIQVIKGPLKGLEGIIEKCDRRKKRVKVALEFLGQIRKVDLGAFMVEKALQGLS